MTNPAQALRMLVTFGICIPVAVLVGYLLTNPLDYSTLGFLGIIIALLASPIFIKWHYPLMVFSLSAPILLYFLKGTPSLCQVLVLASLGIAILERALSSEHRFISVPLLTWPLLFSLGVIIITAELTGGISFHSLSADPSGAGGGKKYLSLFTGALTYFALTSRPIEPKRRHLYLALFFLPGMLSFVSDMFSHLPSPLNYINLIIPASAYNREGSLGSTVEGFKRYGGIALMASTAMTYLLARYGLKAAVTGGRLWLFLLTIILPFFVMYGGFRGMVINLFLIMALLFFFEGLHHSRLMAPMILGLILAVTLVVPFAGRLPLTIQRSLTFLPLNNLDAQAVSDAEGSSEWRLKIWREVWPQVPQYLLLGKGYNLTADDYSRMGQNVFNSDAAAAFDPSSVGLAVSMDYHNGPLSVLMPFGIWGALSFLWFTLAGGYVLYRNYRHGDPDLLIINRFLLIWWVVHLLGFLFIFGNYPSDIGYFGGVFGLSVALNNGLARPAAQPVFHPLIRPQPVLAPETL